MSGDWRWWVVALAVLVALGWIVLTGDAQSGPSSYTYTDVKLKRVILVLDGQEVRRLCGDTGNMVTGCYIPSDETLICPANNLAICGHELMHAIGAYNAEHHLIKPVVVNK